MRRGPLYLIMGLAMVLQVTLVPYAGTETIRPNLPLLVLIVIAMRMGGLEAVIWGAVVGYVMGLISSEPLGMSAFILTLAGFTVGKAFASDVMPPLHLWASASGAGVMTAALTWSVLYSMGTLAPLGVVFLKQAIPSAFYTWALGMLWAISPLYARRGKVHLD